jgi:mevalonate kinase
LNYPSKILLFGEYAIIRGGEALALPLSAFTGEWAFGNDRSLQQNLPAFADYLTRLKREEALLLPGLEVDAFEEDLSDGLYFKSNIPPGYGAGSSGAVVAGVFERYEPAAVKDEVALPVLKAAFAQMEGFFHGASSGIDPIVSYLDRPVLFNSSGHLQVVQFPVRADASLSIFLLDTGQSRLTAPLVKWFLQQCEDIEFQDILKFELLPANFRGIYAYLQSDVSQLWEAVHRISQIQLHYFEYMIPAPLRPLWLEGLSSNDFKLKLCGAGGGGFLLGFSKNFASTQQRLQDYNLHLVDF